MYAFPRNLTINAAYTFTHSRPLENPEDPASIGRQTTNIPRHFAAAGVRWIPQPRWTVALQGRWVDRTFGDSDNTLIQDSHFVADASVGYQLNSAVELFASASNLLDRSYIATNSGFEPAKLGPPFQAFFGMRLRFAPLERRSK